MNEGEKLLEIFDRYRNADPNSGPPPIRLSDRMLLKLMDHGTNLEGLLASMLLESRKSRTLLMDERDELRKLVAKKNARAK